MRQSAPDVEADRVIRMVARVWEFAGPAGRVRVVWDMERATLSATVLDDGVPVQLVYRDIRRRIDAAQARTVAGTVTQAALRKRLQHGGQHA